MAPNGLGMGLYADGGQTVTKPYIASANYIRRGCTILCVNGTMIRKRIQYGTRYNTKIYHVDTT